MMQDLITGTADNVRPLFSVKRQKSVIHHHDPTPVLDDHDGVGESVYEILAELFTFHAAFPCFREF